MEIAKQDCQSKFDFEVWVLVSLPDGAGWTALAVSVPCHRGRPAQKGARTGQTTVSSGGFAGNGWPSVTVKLK
eukprot:scaffold487_cov178-Ochromonas_danica.AAC.19